MLTELFQEDLVDDHENMQDMDILDMNVLDETENESGIPVEDQLEDSENFDRDDDALLDDEQDFKTFESEDEGRSPEVRNKNLKSLTKVQSFNRNHFNVFNHSVF